MEQWKDIMPSLLLSLVREQWVTVLNGGIISIGDIDNPGMCWNYHYVVLAWIFKLECFRYLLSTVKDIFLSRSGETYEKIMVTSGLYATDTSYRIC
jgi:hypothetical protein